MAIKKPWYSYVVLALVVLAVFSALGLGRFGYSMVLPAMQSDMALSNAQTGQLQSWTSVGYLLAVVVAGLLASRWGPRVVVSAALALVGVSMVLTGMLASFPGLCAVRFVTGAGAAAANVPVMGLVAAWFAKKRRGLAAGTAVAGSSLGLVVTGPLVPYVLGLYDAGTGWRVCWYVFGGVSVVIAALCGVLLRNAPHEVGLKPIGWQEDDGAAPTGDRASALDWGSVYKSRYLWQLSAVYFAFGFSYLIYATFFVRHIVRELELSTARAGGLWSQVGLVSIASGFIWGSASDRWGRRPALACIFAVQALAFVVMGVSKGISGVYVAAGLFALTAWSIPAVVSAIAGDVFGYRLAPAALGLITVFFGVGQTLGPYLGGVLADATGSFKLAFIMAGVVAFLVGTGGSLLLPRVEAG